MVKTVGIWILVCLMTASCNWGSVADAKTSSTSDICGIIDPKLRVPQGFPLRHDLFAVGFQIYNFNGTDWALKNVSADLFDFRGRRVGSHFFLTETDENGGQATWETFNPKSRVTAKARTVLPQQDSIPFVLLEFTSHHGDKKEFGSTAFVQRLFTHKGQAPSAENAKIGDVFKSYYTALYFFASPK